MQGRFQNILLGGVQATPTYTPMESALEYSDH